MEFLIWTLDWALNASAKTVQKLTFLLIGSQDSKLSGNRRKKQEHYSQTKVVYTAYCIWVPARCATVAGCVHSCIKLGWSGAY